MSFIDVIVKPLYEEFLGCLDGVNKKDNEILMTLNENRHHWGDRSMSTKSKQEIHSSLPEIKIDTEYKRRSTLTPTNPSNTLDIPRRLRSRSTRDFSKIHLMINTNIPAQGPEGLLEKDE